MLNRKFLKNKTSFNVLVITNMYPSKKNIYAGVFVKEQIELLKKYKNIRLEAVCNLDNRKGFFRIVLKYLKLLFKTLFKIMFNNYDIIHAYYAYPTGFIAILCTLFSRKKVIISVHGSDINEIVFRNKINFILCKFSLNRFGHWQ